MTDTNYFISTAKELLNKIEEENKKAEKDFWYAGSETLVDISNKVELLFYKFDPSYPALKDIQISKQNFFNSQRTFAAEFSKHFLAKHLTNFIDFLEVRISI